MKRAWCSLKSQSGDNASDWNSRLTHDTLVVLDFILDVLSPDTMLASTSY